jgi:hypothetical protein
MMSKPRYMKAEVLTFADRIRPKQETVTIIGSGITALMSAWEVQKAGYQVNVISQSPDPRLKAANEQPQYSSTFDGRDQRYITLFEGHPYLELLEYVQAVYPGIGDDFMNSVLEGGLLALPFEQFSERDREWLEKRKEINDALKSGDKKLQGRIKKLFSAYAEENRAAMEKWYGFIEELLKKDPGLADKISLSSEGIMRLYDTAAVLETSEASHKAGGVFKKSYTPNELKEKFPAYAVGVDNGFIQGGSVEMHGLTLGVKTIGEAMVNILANDKKNPVNFQFDKRVEKIVKSNGKVEGLRIAGEDSLVKSKHYILHPGAMGLQALYEQAAPEIQNVMASMEGYWITIDGADEIVKQMDGKPNKVHGKQSIQSLLDKVDSGSRKKFTRMFRGLGIDDFANVAPIVDFNIMPIYSEDGKAALGIGSGYIFKGLAEPDAKGRPAFLQDKNLKKYVQRSEKFVLALMELWLQALYGKELLDTGEMKIWKTGCKRSWTPDDQEVDRNNPTTEGGVLAIRGGGNTGDTTKSTFVAEYNLALLQAVDELQTEGKEITQRIISETARDVRASLRKKPEEVDFAKLTAELKKKVAAAKKRAAIAERSNRPEVPGSGMAGDPLPR